MTQNGNGQALATKQPTIAERTLARINEFQKAGSIDIPANYSPANALRSAWLILQEVRTKSGAPALTACTKESIANALLKMVVLGLNPAKKQCYFIPYGDKLSCDPSYFGEMSTAKRVHGNIPDDGFSYAVVYYGDDFEFERKRGKVRIIKHGQKLDNMEKSRIMGAYCEIYDGDDRLVNSALMTIEELKQAWRQSRMNPVNDKGEINEGGTHGKFTADMCLKTVIRKACKPIINSSDDKNLNLLKREVPSQSELQAAEEIEAHSCKETIGFSDAEVVEEVQAAQAVGFEEQSAASTAENSAPVKQQAPEPAMEAGPAF